MPTQLSYRRVEGALVCPYGDTLWTVLRGSLYTPLDHFRLDGVRTAALLDNLQGLPQVQHAEIVEGVLCIHPQAGITLPQQQSIMEAAAARLAAIPQPYPAGKACQRCGRTQDTSPRVVEGLAHWCCPSCRALYQRAEGSAFWRLWEKLTRPRLSRKSSPNHRK